MYFKRPSFRRGGSTGIGQLTPRTQARGGGNIGGGTIAGSNLGTRTGFESIILQSSGLPYPDSKPSSTYKPNFNLKGSSFTPRNYPLTVIPNTPSGLSRLLAKYPKSVYGGGLTLGAGFGTGIGLLADAYQRSTKTPLAYKKLKEVSKRPYYFDETNIDVGEGLDEIRAANEIGEAPGFFPRGGKNKFYEDRGLDPETGLPSKDAVTDDSFAEARIKMTDTPNYVDFNEIVEEVVPNKKDKDDDTPKEPSFEDTYEAEKKKLEKLLGDDDDRGMAAIALSEAIGTPGTIADKAAVLNKSLLTIMAGKKKDKKDIAKLAYTATKEIEKAKIVANKTSDSQKNFERIQNLSAIINDTTGTYSDTDKKSAGAQLEIIKESIKVLNPSKTDGSLTGLSSAGKYIDELSKLAKKINKQEKGSVKYNELINQYMSIRNFLSGFNNPGITAGVSTTDSIIGLNTKKDGGRIGFANGTPMEESIQVSETVGQGEVPTAQTPQLSFEEIRNRLPKEITDDVVRLIAGSNEALQDFSYIRTQGDVDKFNMKYGVTLVLPQSTA